MTHFPSARTTVLLVTIGLLLIAGAALGQQPMSPSPPPAGPGFARACAEEPARFAGFIAYLRTRIAIAAEQSEIWDQFVAEAQAGTGPGRDLCASPPDESQMRDPLQSMAVHERAMAARLAALRAMRGALEKLIARLTDPQKVVLTEILSRRPPGPMGMIMMMPPGPPGPR
jgi:hypothetical protein